MDRDGRDNKQLKSLGWTVLRFWESDILEDKARIAATIAEIVVGRRLAGVR